MLNGVASFLSEPGSPGCFRMTGITAKKYYLLSFLEEFRSIVCRAIFSIFSFRKALRSLIMVKEYELEFLRDAWGIEDPAGVLVRVVDSLIETGHVKCIWSSRYENAPKRILFHVLLNKSEELLNTKFVKEKEEHISLLEEKGRHSNVVLRFAELFRRNFPEQDRWRILHDYQFTFCILLDQLIVVHFHIYESVQHFPKQLLTGYRVYGETPFLIQEGHEETTNYQSPIQNPPNRGGQKALLSRFYLELIGYIHDYK